MDSRLRIPGMVVIAALAAVSAGCATSPAPRYFRLAPEAQAGAVTQARAVIIGPFQLAEYLDRPQIVTRDRANAVKLAELERWAEPLDANFQGVVAANVGRLLGSDRVLEFPAQAIVRPERRVTGRVSQLDVDAGGLAVLEVQWGVLDGDGAVREPGRRSRYEVKAAATDYASAVAAMNTAVAKFSEDVAAAVR